MTERALFDRFEGVAARLSAAARRAGRNPKGIRLVAVSKLHSAEAVAALAAYWDENARRRSELGRPLFGENYIQEALEKQAAVAKILAHAAPNLTPEWHFIGHLQSRKAKDTVGAFACIHSLDSLKLAQNLQKAWENSGRMRPLGLHEPTPGPQTALIQVDLAGEEQKSGIAPEELERLLLTAAELSGLAVKGLMCLPPFSENPEETRVFFRRLRELRDTVSARTGLALPELSMGMSHDFEAAIEEGATLVRVGTDIFGPR